MEIELTRLCFVGVCVGARERLVECRAAISVLELRIQENLASACDDLLERWVQNRFGADSLDLQIFKEPDKFGFKRCARKQMVFKHSS